MSHTANPGKRSDSDSIVKPGGLRDMHQGYAPGRPGLQRYAPGICTRAVHQGGRVPGICTRDTHQGYAQGICTRVAGPQASAPGICTRAAGPQEYVQGMCTRDMQQGGWAPGICTRAATWIRLRRVMWVEAECNLSESKSHDTYASRNRMRLGGVERVETEYDLCESR